MRKLTFLQRLLAALFVMVLVAAACGDDDDSDSGDAAVTDGTGGAEDPGESDPAPDPDPAEEDPGEMMEEEPVSITIAIGEGPSKLDPHFQDGEMRRVMENVYERLIERDLDSPDVLLPRLAASLPELIDDTTWEVKLREGISFHNGAPFNAAAAKYSIDRLFDEEVGSDLLEQVDSITSVEVVDDYTIRITTSAADPILPARLYMIQMVEPGLASGNGLATQAAGTGPYMLDEYSSGSHVTLTRNPDYWGDHPQIDNVRFVFLPENQSRVQALQAGDVHMAMGISPDSADDLPKIFARDEGIEYPYLRMKNYEGPLQSVELRQAIAYALNVDDYVEFIYSGQAARPNCHIFGSGVFGHNPDLSDRPYDPDRARELVEASGYDGTEITFLANGTRWTKFDELSEAIAADLEAIGLNIDYQLLAWEVWLFDEFLLPVGEVRGDMFLSSSSNELQDADRLASYVGSESVTSSYDNPAMVDALTEARNTLDVDERRQKYHDILAQNCDEVGILPVLTYLNINGGAENLEWTPRYDDTARVEDMTLS